MRQSRQSSPRKAAANRRNAARSTGPRTVRGKKRASRNAFRHGLASAAANPIAKDVKSLAEAIAQAAPSRSALHFAAIAAEAHLEIIRVRLARAACINQAALDPSTFAPPRRIDPKLVERARPGLDPEVLRKIEGLLHFLENRPLPEEDDRPALALGLTAKQLLAFDRYEKRAFSRKRRALRSLDAAQFAG